MGSRSFTKKEQQRIILPLTRKFIQRQHGKPLVVGIQGGQGTGKTTIAGFLQQELEKQGLRVAAISLDDFYIAWSGRKKLQEQFPDNPFYQISRGMPGTHRIPEILQVLRTAKQGKPFTVPVFDKSLSGGKGDRSGQKNYPPVDMVLFEGWCVGMPVVSSQEVVKICQRNAINLKILDPQLQYHKVVLECTKLYQNIWKLLDFLVMIKPDTSEVHNYWRLLQEKKLQNKKKQGMTPAQIKTFVQPFLPFTYVCYDRIKANAIIHVDRKHNYYKLQF